MGDFIVATGPSAGPGRRTATRWVAFHLVAQEAVRAVVGAAAVEAGAGALASPARTAAAAMIAIRRVVMLVQLWPSVPNHADSWMTTRWKD